ncbi:MAG: DUF502 domain-containing protein [Candidatus Hydrogenedentes bacterium]|jgi:uncharacterized membrane protein|nr:DUF502 domain-containing protein [Candidatus Hydrogenedentota bacterium]
MMAKKKQKKKLSEASPLFRFLIQYFKQLRFYLMTGLLVWMPLIVTVWLTIWLFKKVGGGVASIIESLYGQVNAIGEKYERLQYLTTIEYVPGTGFKTGFLIAAGLFLTTGFFTRYLVGRKTILYGEQILNRIPFIKNVYKAVQQIRDVFINRGGAVFQEVCLVEYPRKGIYAVAFVTSREQGLVQRTTGIPQISIFLPTTPNPTSGFLLYVDPNEIKTLDISVEDAMKLIISGGAFMPSAELPGLLDAEEEVAKLPS